MTCGELAHDRALVDDGDPVGELEDLVEVLADHQHPAPSAAASRRYACTVSVAPTSRPRVGEATTITRGSPENSRASTTFWMFPPEAAGPARSGPGAAIA